MNSLIMLTFTIAALLVAGGHSLMCTQWVSKDTALVFNKPGTCHGPEIHISGNNWRLCCDRLTRRQLTVHEHIEPLIPDMSTTRSSQKCTRWMESAISSRIAIPENACNTSIYSETKDGQIRICC